MQRVRYVIIPIRLIRILTIVPVAESYLLVDSANKTEVIKAMDLADTAHYFMAINCNLFGDTDAIKKSCSELLDDLRACPSYNGRRIYVHGEKEAEIADVVRSQGITVNIKTVEEIKEIAKRLNVSCEINVTEE